jgi:hypothetical protein
MVTKNHCGLPKRYAALRPYDHMNTMFQSFCSLVLTVQLAVLLSAGSACAQDSVWHRECGQFTCCDSTVLLGDDSVKIIYGYNSSLGLRFWSRDIYELIQYFNRLEKVHENLTQSLRGWYFQTYLDVTPDTSRWQTYRSPRFALSFRHPPGIQVLERLDSSSRAYTIELGLYAMPDSLTPPNSVFLVFARISFTADSLAQVAANRGWFPRYRDCWYIFQSKESSGHDFHNMSYLEGNQWKCIRGLEFYRPKPMVLGDSIKFLSIIERPPKSALVLDFFEKALRHAPVYIFEADMFMLLSSVRFDD